MNEHSTTPVLVQDKPRSQQRLRTYSVAVQTIIMDTYEIPAQNPDEAHKAAIERANNHLRDDGQMLRISSTIEGGTDWADTALDMPVPNL